MTYDGSVWKTVGTAGFSDGKATNLAIAADGESVYAAYLDQENGNRISVKKYNLREIGKIEDQRLSNLTEGYAEGTQETRTLEIHRAYAGRLNHPSVRLTGDGADSFIFTQPLATTLDQAVPETTFTIRAKAALPVGTYKATIVVENHARLSSDGRAGLIRRAQCLRDRE